MAGQGIIPGDEQRGIAALRGSIQGAVRAGYTLDQTLTTLQNLYAQYGGRWTSQSAAAATRQYQTFQDIESRAQALSHVRGNITIGSSWISYATLDRSLPEFNQSPAYQVRFRVAGNLEGAPISRWQTATYANGEALPPTVGALKEDLNDAAVTSYPDVLTGADFEVSDVAIYAV